MATRADTYIPTYTTGETAVWFVRENKHDLSPFGPVSLTKANMLARLWSRSNASGLMEVVAVENGRTFVVHTFLRGKLRYQGHRAQQASDNDLPPTL